MTWRAPYREERRVWRNEDGDRIGWKYVTDSLYPGWTSHLTNALHDAGWWVTRERRRKERREEVRFDRKYWTDDAHKHARKDP